MSRARDLALRFMRYVLPMVPGWLHDVPLWRWQVLHQIRHACSWIPLRPVVSLVRALPALCWELPQVKQSLVEERICHFCIRLSSRQMAPKRSGIPMTGTDR